METLKFEADLSDDEIFFGDITINEIKKIFCNREGPSKKHVSPKKDLCTRLIETHSQPNLISKVDSPVFSPQNESPATNRKSDESFVQMENMVSKLCMSPRNSDNEELNSTSEIIDYILNHEPNKIKQGPVRKHDQKEDKDSSEVSPIKINTEKLTLKMETLNIPENADNKSLHNCNTPVTPPSIIQSKKPLFKTPANPSMLKRYCTPRGTPGKTKAYQHISSPIASYIKNSPQVPLVKDVHPKKPLPRSSIPKFARNPSQSQIQRNENKENIDLPSVAYKSAKITKVVQLPDENKLPQRLKKIYSFPRPTVIKHENREMSKIKKLLLSNQENSFENLSCHQAEVSFCTEKTVVSTDKH